MYRCQICDTLCYSIIDCQKHIESEHPDEDVERCTRVGFECGFCGLSFGHRTDVKNHALREHGLQQIEVREVAV